VMTKKKHFLVDVVVYGLPLLVSRGMGFLLLPIYTRYLSPEDYGVLEMVTVLFVLLNLTLPLEIKQAVARFLPEQKNIEDKSKVASNAYWLTCVVFTVFALFAFVIPETLSMILLDNTNHILLMQIAGVSMLANALFQVIQTQLRFDLKAKQAASIAMIYTLVTGATAVILLVIYSFGIKSMLLGQLSGSLLGLGVGLIYCHKGIKIRFTFDVSKLKEMLHFSTPLVFSSVGVYLGMFIDRWMLAKWLSLEEVGVYSVAYKFATVIGLLFFAIGQALVPLILNHYKEAETPVKIDQILRLLLAIVLPALVFLSFFAEPIVHWLTGENFLRSAPLIVWLAISVVLMNLYRFAPGMDIMKKTKRIAAINLSAAALNIVMNAVLIPLYDSMGAAVATIASAALMFGLYVFFSQKEYPIPYNWKRYIGATIVTLAFVITFTFWQYNISYSLPLFLGISFLLYKILITGNEIRSIRF